MFQMGAVNPDKSGWSIETLGPNQDPDAEDVERPVRAVTLAPFFISKFEVTQGQWLRATGENPSHYRGDTPKSLLHPVEQVRWEECNEVLRNLGLVLPTEAQWEYAARADTQTVWWTGNDRESLKGRINLADQAAAREHAPWQDIKDWQELDDGYASHAPVGTFAANFFGLHEVHGNVQEWCRDLYAHYSDQAPADQDARNTGDGLLKAPPRANLHALRGGSFVHAARSARSAARKWVTFSYLSDSVGVRPARPLTVP
jgi:formylglycine-generating enzyme required for sulfatase activity